MMGDLQNQNDVDYFELENKSLFFAYGCIDDQFLNKQKINHSEEENSVSMINESDSENVNLNEKTQMK
jgi:hypothetical protein